MTNYPDLRLFIAGDWRQADGQPVVNPADCRYRYVVLAAAEQGFKVWSRTSPAKRAELILEAVRLMRERVEKMAIAMTLEQGKPIAQSRLEILRGCDIIEWDAQEGRRIYGRIIPSEPGMRHSVLRQPIGVVAAFSPWNFPMSSPARKVGGALSAGCSIILKASEETPAGAVQLVQAFADVGLPAGVLNLVFGQTFRHFGIPDSAAGRATGDVHRFGSGRQASVRHGGRPHEAGHHGTGRPRPGDHVRRYRSGVERGHIRRRQIAQCRTGLRLAHTLLRRGRDLRALRGCLRREG